MQKLKFESPKGEAIHCRIRLKSILCIDTNFDSFRYIDLAENIAKSEQIESFDAVHIYEDESGYWIFRLADVSTQKKCLTMCKCGLVIILKERGKYDTRRNLRKSNK